MEIKMNQKVNKTGENLVSFLFEKEIETIYMDGDIVVYYNEEGKGINNYGKKNDPFTAQNPEVAHCFNREFHDRISKALDDIAAMPAQESEEIEHKLKKLEFFCNEALSQAFTKVVGANSEYPELLMTVKSQKHTEEYEKQFKIALQEALRSELAKAQVKDILLLTNEDDVAKHIKDFAEIDGK